MKNSEGNFLSLSSKTLKRLLAGQSFGRKRIVLSGITQMQTCIDCTWRQIKKKTTEANL